MRRGAWEWTVVAQCPPELSGLPSRRPFLPPQDWYLARASEKMAPISPTSPPIPSYWEDKAGEEGEKGTSLASAGAWWEDREGEGREGRLTIDLRSPHRSPICNPPY